LPNVRLGGTACGAGPVAPVPLSPTANWPPPAALPVKVIRPEAGPATVGLNATVKLQVALAASVAPHVVVWVNGPVMPTPEIFNTPFPVFFKVTTCVPLVPPTTCLAKFKMFGISDTPAVWMPLPENLKVNDGVPGASVCSVSVPVRRPGAVGAKITATEQVP
jgi:hypothetical protein